MIRHTFQPGKKSFDHNFIFFLRRIEVRNEDRYRFKQGLRALLRALPHRGTAGPMNLAPLVDRPFRGRFGARRTGFSRGGAPEPPAEGTLPDYPGRL